MVRPSCPALVIHADDEFRKSLIATLDAQHFTVTFVPDGNLALDLLRERDFRVVIVGLDVAKRSLDTLREIRTRTKCGVILLGDPNPELRTLAPWADETLLKPVDASYIAQRASSYCAHE